MMYSMTGFGRHEFNVGKKLFIADIKSLNGKQFELNVKLPALLRPLEFDIRQLINEKLIRGSIDCTITLKETGEAKPVQINTDLLKAYYHQIKITADELQISSNDILTNLLKLPEVLIPVADNIEETEKQLILSGIQEAISKLTAFRQQEGQTLQNDILQRIENIQQQAKQVKPLAAERKERVRGIILQALEQLKLQNSYDEQRLEQELVYYAEKFDIAEEQTRLAQHCQYFNNHCKIATSEKGKKLGFILQEIGREINTMGSKANHAGIQQAVVTMKEELEKAKEQILNIL
jgi:uncharacterized protein (TIGR00255 family)